jgi:hypothetical protein
VTSCSRSLTHDEREIVLGNLIHDLAGLDATTEEEAGKLYDRLVAEGRIDPAATGDAHRRLLVRLGLQPSPSGHEPVSTADCLRAYEEYKGVSRAEIARELGVCPSMCGQRSRWTRHRSPPTIVLSLRPVARWHGAFVAKWPVSSTSCGSGRMKLLESVGEAAEVYARKEEPKKP